MDFSYPSVSAQSDSETTVSSSARTRTDTSSADHTYKTALWRSETDYQLAPESRSCEPVGPDVVDNVPGRTRDVRPVIVGVYDGGSTVPVRRHTVILKLVYGGLQRTSRFSGGDVLTATYTPTHSDR